MKRRACALFRDFFRLEEPIKNAIFVVQSTIIYKEMRKYISPGAWFSLEYPDSWREFEDTEDSFLFYNPDKWTGNFRISAYRGGNGNYAKEAIDYELEHVRGARFVKAGAWPCAYSSEDFQENDSWYTSHVWVTGKGDVCVECSFVVPKGESFKAAEAVVSSLRVRGANDKPWREVIPVRVMEISLINECYDWAVSTVKKQFAKDFSDRKDDVVNLQKAIDSGRFDKKQPQAWECFGIAFGAILVNEMDGMEWVTVVDGAKEFPALRFSGSDVMAYPLQLVWDKVRNGKPCRLAEEYARIQSEVEDMLEQKAQ